MNNKPKKSSRYVSERAIYLIKHNKYTTWNDIAKHNKYTTWNDIAKLKPI